MRWFISLLVLAASALAAHFCINGLYHPARRLKRSALFGHRRIWLTRFAGLM